MNRAERINRKKIKEFILNSIFAVCVLAWFYGVLWFGAAWDHLNKIQ